MRQAESEFHRVQSFVYQLEALISQKENEISFLLGRSPSPVLRGRSVVDQPIPPQVPAGLPASLLERRPDVRQAEEELIAANARIGEAIAMRYPRIALTGSYGFASTDLDNLLDGTSEAWNLFAGLTQPIFSAGKNKRRVEVRQSQQRQAAYAYETCPPAGAARGRGRSHRPREVRRAARVAGRAGRGRAQGPRAVRAALPRRRRRLPRGPRRPAILVQRRDRRSVEHRRPRHLPDPALQGARRRLARGHGDSRSRIRIQPQRKEAQDEFWSTNECCSCLPGDRLLGTCRGPGDGAGRGGQADLRRQGRVRPSRVQRRGLGGARVSGGQRLRGRGVVAARARSHPQGRCQGPEAGAREPHRDHS